MNDEREEAIEYSRRDAELPMVDADLWIQDPELLYGFEPEDAVEQWTKAYVALDSFADVATHINEATLQAVLDARERARQALVRAKERVRENS
jgi:hypothetical protein